MGLLRDDASVCVRGNLHLDTIEKQEMIASRRLAPGALLYLHLPP